MQIHRSIFRPAMSVLLAALMATPSTFAASHREAPITALDQKADITDWFAFVSPEDPSKVIMILNVDPFLEPSNGPNYFPFDPGILYEMKVDWDNDGIEDVKFQFRFQTTINNPGLFTGYVGNLAGIPPITSLTGPGAAGLNTVQTYSVKMITKFQETDLGMGQTLTAVPTNVGPRTMPNYAALRQEGVYKLANNVRVFAGTVGDPFYIDLGGFFDSLNFRVAAGGGVLSTAIDMDNQHNYAPNALAGFNVNTIALEVPITMLTRDGQAHMASDKRAVIGTWGTTSRRKTSVLRDGEETGEGAWAQVQRMGNPLINEGIIGTGSKDKFSTDIPSHDGQFASFFLSPLLATVFSTIGIPVPAPPRTDLLPLVQYAPPICPGCTAADAGPIADLLRLNTGIAPTPVANAQRLGFLVGDNAGFPNGRRPVDDVLDIAARAIAGILVDPVKFGTRIGDGVNVSAAPMQSTFPFLAPAYDGRDSAHSSGPGLPGCSPMPVCPVN